MKPFLFIVGFWGAVLLGAWVYVKSDIYTPPGVLAPTEPLQVDIEPRSWTRGDVHFTALARFDIQARVLSINHYLFDQQSDLSPVDFALGWGRMSDSSVLEGLKISQGLRFYYWNSRFRRPLPIPRQEIISHSANMHMIPADEGVKKTLLEVRKDEIVTLKGFLVLVQRANGWSWKTSMSRTDTGPGACEVVWVEIASHRGTVMERANR